MAQTQSQTASDNNLEELKRRVKVVEKAINEVLSLVEEPYDWEKQYEVDERIAKILEFAVPPGLEYFNLFEHSSVEEDKAVLEIYEKYFPGWLDDECMHYLLIKLADDKYAIIYSCSRLFKMEKMEFKIAVNGEVID